MVRWYVLQVTTGQETGVRDALQTLGIRAAVPREERAIRSGADGIGLFRSEFLYMQRQDGAGVQRGELLPGEGNPPCAPIPRL